MYVCMYVCMYVYMYVSLNTMKPIDVSNCSIL